MLSESFADFQNRTLAPLAEKLGEQGSGLDLLIVPGALAGLPVHAARLGDEPIYRRFVRTVYEPTLAAPGLGQRDWHHPRTALCILSDPSSERRRLMAAPKETLEVAAALAALGTDVSIVASVGENCGAKVFADRGLAIPPGVSIIENRPTRDWLGSNLANWDHVFYSGHGHVDGLLIVDDEGHEASLSAAEILGFSALSRSPTFLLNACESAYESGASTAEFFSVSSCLLRIGARAVIGALWLVRDVVAGEFSRAFYAALQPTPDPFSAFRAALDAIRSSSSNGLIDWGAYVALAAG